MRIPPLYEAAQQTLFKFMKAATSRVWLPVDQRQLFDEEEKTSALVMGENDARAVKQGASVEQLTKLHRSVFL